MRIRYFFFMFIIVLAGTAAGQNQLNDEGKRTGPWKGYYPDSTLRYDAVFKDGRPTGLMKRYDEKGRLAATMNFYSDGDRCFVKMYSDNGNVKARGVYDQQEKDSTWQYLGKDGSVRMEEKYDNGKLSGFALSYYPSGSLSRKIRYSAGEKDGPWIQFFENGDTMLVTNYDHGMLHGSYKAYYPGGRLQITGEYHNDLKDSEWKYFSEEGEMLTQINYDEGTVLNPEVLEKSYETFIRKIEENVGNIPDPALEGFQ